MKKNIIVQFINIINEEFKKSEGYNKFLILALIANIPILSWIPYVVQAITIVLIALFIKNYLQIKTLKEDAKRLVLVLSGVTVVAQVIWFPFITQLITLVLLGVLYNAAQPQMSQKTEETKQPENASS